MKVIGSSNVYVLNRIVSDLTNNRNKPYRGFVKGPTCSGKTSLVNHALESQGFNVLFIDIISNASKGDPAHIKDMISNYTKNNTIDSMLFNKKKAIFIDNIDIMQDIDKSTFQACHNLISNQAIKIPIIVTLNSKNEKSIVDLKRQCSVAQHYTIGYPSVNDIRTHVLDVVRENNITFCTCDCSVCDRKVCDADQHNDDHCETCEMSCETDTYLVTRYIKFHKCKVNKVLDNIKRIHEFVDPNKYDDTTSSDNVFADLYTTDIATKICNQPEKMTFADILRLSLHDTNIISYTIHENIPLCINERYPKNRPRQLSTLMECTKSLCHADILDTHMTNNLIWNEVFVSCVTSTKLMGIKHSLQHEKRIKPAYTPFRFTSLLTKYARCCNSKKKTNALMLHHDITRDQSLFPNLMFLQLVISVVDGLVPVEDISTIIHKTDTELITRYVSDSNIPPTLVNRWKKLIKKM